jgi:opacity protein-like surface antigen
MHRVLKTLIVTGALALVLAPAQARADGFFSPWIGSAFGAGRGISTDNIDAGATTFGITAGGMGAGIIGGEIDFGYSPSFFGDKQVFGANSIINLMGNVVVGVPVGGQTGAGIRPYVTAGLGLLRTQIDGGNLGNSSQSDNAVGWNAGAGVMGYFADHIGVRGDLRYIRGFNESDFGIFDATNLGALRFWRASIGVVIR